MNANLNTLPYCDTSLGVNETGTYQTAIMPGPWDKLSCLRFVCVCVCLCVCVCVRLAAHLT